MEEMEHLRQVLDYMPCSICENVVPEEERRYMCSICARINRIISAERAIPKWKVDEDGRIVAEEGMEMEELKPSIKIIEEEEEKEEEKIEIEVLEVGEDIKDEELTIEEHLPEWEAVENDVYTHGDYILYTKEATLRGGRKQRIYFFSKKKEVKDATPSPLPEGYEVGINKKTGLPYLRKKK